MSVRKRTTKVVCYDEQDDDDDFVSIGSVTKKNRAGKSSDASKESKLDTKQLPRKHDENLPELKQEEPTLVLECPRKSSEGSTIKNPIVIADQEDTSSQSTVSSDESQTSHQDENLLPTCKRMKHNEDDDINENESICETEETIKKPELARISSSDLNTVRSSNHPTKRSSVPLGFPTSKINIPSPHTSRVGLSRKSSTIKSLHPNFTSHSLHE